MWNANMSFAIVIWNEIRSKFRKLELFAVKMVAHNKTSKTLQESYRVLCVMWSLDWWLIDNVIPLGHRIMTDDH